MKRERVAKGDQPERARAQRLTRREIARRVVFLFSYFHLRRTIELDSIDHFPAVGRPVVDQRSEREAGDDGDDARHQRGGAPAVGLQRPGDERRDDAAEGEADRQRGERARAKALEPVDERNVERKEAAASGAERDDDERAVEAGQGVDLREQDQPQAEDHDAGAHEGARAEAIEQPAQHRAEHGGFHLVQRRGARERGLAPAALVGEHRHVGAEGLHHQAGLQELQAARGPDHLPAVEQGFHVEGRRVPQRTP